jgi:hypothetical protein
MDPWAVFIILTILGVLGGVIYAIVDNIKKGSVNRPVKDGFYGGAITGTSTFPCSRMSSEASELLGLFIAKAPTVGEEGKTDLRDLRDILSKMCCMKQDLMSPAQTLTAAKELGFSTHQDIQPVADLTARCFTKTIPERDLSVQFIKWRDAGLDLIRRLCTSSQMTEKESQLAEKLFTTAWKDVNNVAETQCLQGPPKNMYLNSPHEPSARVPDDLEYLREYDGLY